MKVDTGILKQLVHGAVDIQENNGLIYLRRFTPDQLTAYQSNPNFMIRAMATAGIRLDFRTDAVKVVLNSRLSPGSSRSFYYFDVLVNGDFYQHCGGENWQEQQDFTLRLPLNGQLNRVSIYFPCLCCAAVRSLELEGATQLLPVHCDRSILCFGDSITQGYDARFPSLAYPNQFADQWNIDVVNKGIGGERFNPEVVRFPDPGRPGLITVAYGTNDWSGGLKADFRSKVPAFFDRLVNLYPEIPVVVILPLWREDMDRITPVGSFTEASEFIRTASTRYNQIRCLDGLKLIPHLLYCFMPDRLHPSDFGFQFLGRSLMKKIKLR